MKQLNADFRERMKAIQKQLQHEQQNSFKHENQFQTLYQVFLRDFLLLFSLPVLSLFFFFFFQLLTFCFPLFFFFFFFLSVSSFWFLVFLFFFFSSSSFCLSLLPLFIILLFQFPFILLARNADLVAWCRSTRLCNATTSQRLETGFFFFFFHRFLFLLFLCCFPFFSIAASSVVLRAPEADCVLYCRSTRLYKLNTPPHHNAWKLPQIP